MPRRPGEPRKETKPPGIPYNLPAPPTTPRDCLRCGREFGSIDRVRNRICAKCNDDNAKLGKRDVSRPVSLPTGVLSHEGEN